MSRIGNKPIEIPEKVKCEIKGSIISVTGPIGSMEQEICRGLEFKEVDNTICLVNSDFDNKELRSMHGLYRSLVANMVFGVSTGFEKELEINGVGYRVQQQGNDVQLFLGYSHPVIYKAPEGIKIEVIDQTHLKIKGCDKQSVGQVAAEIRSLRPPEPYKGKGIKYKEEIIRRKAGKAGK